MDTFVRGRVWKGLGAATAALRLAQVHNLFGYVLASSFGFTRETLGLELALIAMSFFLFLGRRTFGG